MKPSSRPTLAALALVATVACGGGGDAPPPRPPGLRNVELTWNANHERDVNAPGGGYLVTIDGPDPVFVVSYVSGALAPTFLATTLHTGPHTFSVRAYAVDPLGVATVTPAATATIQVP